MSYDIFQRIQNSSKFVVLISWIANFSPQKEFSFVSTTNNILVELIFPACWYFRACFAYYRYPNLKHQQFYLILGLSSKLNLDRQQSRNWTYSLMNSISCVLLYQDSISNLIFLLFSLLPPYKYPFDICLWKNQNND